MARVRTVATPSSFDEFVGIDVVIFVTWSGVEIYVRRGISRNSKIRRLLYNTMCRFRGFYICRPSDVSKFIEKLKRLLEEYGISYRLVMKLH